MELLHDPDADLSDAEFKDYYPDSGDKFLHEFSDDDLAYRYASLYKRCVSEDGACVFCRRWDH